MLARVLYQDPFSPVLLESPPVNVSQEQTRYINEAIDIACSDSQFAEKLKKSISYILMGGTFKSPTITSLSPTTAAIGSASFTLHVRGTNFTPASKIIFAGNEEPTTFVSASEITTEVDMSVWLGPDMVTVEVQDANGVMSNSSNFTFTAAGTQSTQTKTDEKVLKHDDKEKK